MNSESVHRKSPLAILPVRSELNHDLREALEQSGIQRIFLRGLSDLPLARSVLFTEALRHRDGPILCLDSDIVATRDQLLRLVNHPRVTPKSAVTGRYVMRSGAAWAAKASGDVESDGCRTAAWAGLGFCCIHADSLRRARDLLGLTELQDPEYGSWWPFAVPFIDGKEYFADDRSLWDRLGLTGTQLYEDTSLVAGHLTTVALTNPSRSGYDVPAGVSCVVHDPDPVVREPTEVGAVRT